MIRRLGFALAVLALVSGTGLLLRAEPPQTVGTWASIGAAPENRIDAAAVALPDGRTLIVGGLTNGTPTDAVVVFDPADSSFATAGQLLEPRAGHTATLLEDGHVLIAGGTVNELLSGDLEVFDPSTGTSTLVASLAQLRSGHAAARFGSEGKVLIAGGTGTDGVLQTAEIFDPATGSVSLTGSALNIARNGASATTLIDGRVLIAGGNNGSQDLKSAEIYNPSTDSFQPTDTDLDVPRRGHTAVLLPHNNSVLIVGGSWDQVPQASADLFLPAQFPDPFSYGMGQFALTGEMAAPRSGAAGGPHIEGYAFVVGGGQPDAEVYRFATIKTDKDDYAPGERAVITGSGWKANEEVTLLFQEDPAVHADYQLTVTADGDGNIYHDQWAPEQHDLGVRFYLLATGSQSHAQTTFLDGNNENTTVSVSCSPNPVVVGNATTCQAQVNNVEPSALNGFPQGTVTFSAIAGLTGSFSPVSATCTLVQIGSTLSSSCGGVSFAPSTDADGSVKATYNRVDNRWANVNNDAALTVNAATPNVTVAVSPTSVAEDGVPNLVYTFSRSGSTTTALNGVNFSVGGTASFSTDYTQTGAVTFTSSAGTINFSAGSSTVVVTVNPSTDTSFEPDETVILTVTSGTGYNVGTPSVATGTITNDDPAPNTAPVAVDDSATVNEDSVSNVINVLANDTDADNLSPTPPNTGLTVLAVGAASHGTATLTAGVVTYTPTANYCGPDSVTYTVSDNGTSGAGHTDEGTVSVTVTCINDTPDAVDDSASVAEDSLTGVFVDVLSNDTKGPNESGQTLTINFVSTPSHGTAEVESGQIRYIPTDADYFGPDSFTYTIQDDGQTNGVDDFKTDTATVSITVTPVNDPPDAVDDSGSVAEDDATGLLIDVLANDTTGPANEGGQTLTLTLVGTPSHGTAVIESGKIRYKPTEANYFGADSFTYTIQDNGQTSGVDDFKTDTATVSITVTPVNDPPDAVNDSASVAEDDATGVLVDVLSNDTKGPANESGQTLTITFVSTPSHGTAAVEAGQIRYTPTDANYFGPDSFTYTIQDNGQTNGVDDFKSGTATVSITVTPVNDAPSSLSLSLSATTIDENGSTVLSGSFTDVETGDSHTVEINWGDGSAVTTVPLSAGVVAIPSTSHTYLDDHPTGTTSDSFTITVKVTDDGQSGSPLVNDPKFTTGNTGVTVNNVNPSKTTSSFTFDPYTGVANASVSFSDPGRLDTVSAAFDWAGTPGGGTPAVVGPGAASPLTGTFTGTQTFTGCVAGAIGVRVSDDDTGYFDHTFAPANTLGLYTAAFLAPIKDDVRNVVKHGNVIPVKVEIRDCHGNLVTNRTLSIVLYAGMSSPAEVAEGDLVIASSVSSADSGNTMRLADGHYMYNLATKPLTLGFPYTIWIKDGTMTVATAVITTKK